MKACVVCFNCILNLNALNRSPNSDKESCRKKLCTSKSRYLAPKFVKHSVAYREAIAGSIISTTFHEAKLNMNEFVCHLSFFLPFNLQGPLWGIIANIRDRGEIQGIRVRYPSSFRIDSLVL